MIHTLWSCVQHHLSCHLLVQWSLQEFNDTPTLVILNPHRDIHLGGTSTVPNWEIFGFRGVYHWSIQLSNAVSHMQTLTLTQDIWVMWRKREFDANEGFTPLYVSNALIGGISLLSSSANLGPHFFCDLFTFIEINRWPHHKRKHQWRSMEIEQKQIKPVSFSDINSGDANDAHSFINQFWSDPWKVTVLVRC